MDRSRDWENSIGVLFWVVLGIEFISVVIHSTGGKCIPFNTILRNLIHPVLTHFSSVQAQTSHSNPKTFHFLDLFNTINLSNLLSRQFYYGVGGYFVVVIIVPSFIAMCLNLNSMEYYQMTFALARSALMWVFSSARGLSFALDSICVEVITLSNFILVCECYFRQRYMHSRQLQRLQHTKSD
uniref:Uncharacterized protein n=1 Tax=Timspurckia oligopyrenoides TaxID=708627 RepID=A0A7S0ZCR5_9RHOD|mmetsp:Transcript_12748/g.22920  ORF Transcript_12748/g.22920 Transcript_12748/m.22920 type:complete len:183 (+) Transcript_12748:2-550(+)